MPIARLSIRPVPGNRLHNLWLNNGTYWAHYTLHWDGRKRRIRRSLRTSDADVVIARRDALFATIAAEGEEVPERAPRRRPAERPPAARVTAPALSDREPVRGFQA